MKTQRRFSLKFCFNTQARDMVDIFQFDSSKVNDVLSNSKSQGSNCLYSSIHSSLHHPETKNVDVSLLVACWKPSYRKFADALNAAFIPEFENIYCRTSITANMKQETERLYGLPFLDPRTMLVLKRLRSNETPRRHRQRLSALYSDIRARYFLDLSERYNRMSSDHRIEPKDEAAIVQLCRLLVYRNSTLSDLSRYLAHIVMIYPKYSLGALNCNLFCNSVRGVDIWRGYYVLEGYSFTARRSRFMDVSVVVCSILAFILFPLVVVECLIFCKPYLIGDFTFFFVMLIPGIGFGSIASEVVSIILTVLLVLDLLFLFWWHTCFILWKRHMRKMHSTLASEMNASFTHFLDVESIIAPSGPIETSLRRRRSTTSIVDCLSDRSRRMTKESLVLHS